jgi:hypothetical protein
MKKTTEFLLVILFLSGTALAQVIHPDQVPATVKKGLQERFPTARRVEWKIKSDKNYEAEFSLKGTDIAVKLDSTGKWLETESAAPRSKVPTVVKDTIARRFKGYKIVEVQTVQRWNEQQVVWEIHLENANETVKAQFDGEGAIISRSAKPRSRKM